MRGVWFKSTTVHDPGDITPGRRLSLPYRHILGIEYEHPAANRGLCDINSARSEFCMGEHKDLPRSSGVHVYCMRVIRIRPTRVCFGLHMALEMHRLIIERGLKNVRTRLLG
jgi:hypothetical protein